MLAKCETDEMLVKDEKFWIDYDYAEVLKKYKSEYFDRLKSDYKNTKYYKEVIKECGVFRSYVKK